MRVSDVETILASHHKNVAAMMRANRYTLDGFQAIWRRQLDFIQEAAGGLAALAGDFTQPATALDVVKHADYSKRALEKNLTTAREVTELASKATGDAMNVINQRFCEGLGEMSRSRERWNCQTTTSTDPAPDR
jgi:phasin family protein